MLKYAEDQRVGFRFVKAIEPEPADAACQPRTAREQLICQSQRVIWVSIDCDARGMSLEVIQYSGLSPSDQCLSNSDLVAQVPG